MLYIIIHAQPITCSTYYNSFKIITYGQIILSYYIMWLCAADIIIQCNDITILGLIQHSCSSLSVIAPVIMGLRWFISYLK